MNSVDSSSFPFLPGGRARAPGARILAAALVAALAACSSSSSPDTESETDLLARLAGTWDGTEMVLTSRDSDPEVTLDILGGGLGADASFTLELEESGRYTATLVVLDQPDEETGDIEITESAITLDPDGPDPAVTGTWDLEGDTLVIQGETQFDFDLDGTNDPADLDLVLERR